MSKRFESAKISTASIHNAALCVSGARYRWVSLRSLHAGRTMTGEDKGEGLDLSCPKQRRASLARYAWHHLNNEGAHNCQRLAAALRSLAQLIHAQGYAKSERAALVALQARYGYLSGKVKPSSTEDKNTLLRYAYADILEGRQ